MKIETAKRLCKINTEFYQTQGRSFSETRQAPWPGWGRCLDVLLNEWEAADQGLPNSLFVFDLACGNLRFEEYLRSALPNTDLACYVVDNCDTLVASSRIDENEGIAPFSVQYQNIDVLKEYLEDRYVGDSIEAPPCDLSVAFGFMHHIPTRELRREVLFGLINQTNPGGYVVVSFWQFLNDENLSAKAIKTHKQALGELGFTDLDENDFLLGWQNMPSVYRYCHSYSENEIDYLLAAVANRAKPIARFVSDGRTDDLNTYIILKVC